MSADDAIIDTQSDLLVSCSMDKTLVATDITSGKVIWRAELMSAPLCLDITPDGAYVGMGTYTYVSVFTYRKHLMITILSSHVVYIRNA